MEEAQQAGISSRSQIVLPYIAYWLFSKMGFAEEELEMVEEPVWEKGCECTRAKRISASIYEIS